MKFVTLYNRVLINIELNIFDDDKIYEKLCKLYEDKTENNELLMRTIKEYDFQPENWWKRKFINTLLKVLLDNDKLWEEISTEIKWLIYQKINEMLWKEKIKGEYLEFSILFRLSPKKEDIVKIEDKFDLTHYLYWYFLRYYFSKKDYERFCRSLKIYLDKYFEDLDDNKFFVLGDSDYESRFKVGRIANTFLEYFIDNFNELINLILNYQVHYSSIELLCRNASSDLAQKFLKLLLNEYLIKHNFRLESHIRGEEFEKMIRAQNEDAEFWKYIFDKFSLWEFQAFDIWFYVLKWIITPNNILQFFSYNWEDYIILNLYYLYDEADIIGKEIYKKYKRIIDNNKKFNDERRARENSNKLKKEKEIKDKIKWLMEKDIEDVKLQKKKYPCREIIYLYREYPDYFSKDEIEFVKNEIKFYFSCDEIKLRDSKTEVVTLQNNSFRIPRFIRDLVLCVSIHERLWIDISKHTDILIWLIPYLFDSELNLILNNLLKYKIAELGKKDVKWLIDIYLDKRQKDLGKFQNTRIPFLISKWFININELNKNQQKEIYQIYKNKLSDENVSYWEKKIFLDSILEIWVFDKERIYEEYRNIFQNFLEYNYYEDYLLGNIDVDLVEDYEKFLKINEILISLYKDEDCIKWRLKQLKWIKTNYIWKGWEVRWLTKRDDEIFWSNSKDERFYMCLIKVINYPQYIEDVKEILLNIQKVEFNEEDYVRWYIYDFCLEYFKTASDDKQLKEALLINDKIFVKRYLLKIMSEENKSKYREQEFQRLYFNMKEETEIVRDLKIENELLREENGKLLQWNTDLEKELEKYKTLFDNDEIEIFLYVEWRTDKFYLDMAHRCLKSYKNLKIRVINCCWANEILNTILAYFLDWKKWIHIWLFDFDSWWISARSVKNHDKILWTELRYKNMREQDLFDDKIFVNKCKINNNSHYSLILLPILTDYIDQIFFDGKISNQVVSKQSNHAIQFLESKGVIYNDFSHPLLTIEHFLWDYFNNSYEEFETFWWNKLKCIKNDNDKKKIMNDIKNSIDRVPQSIWENFEPIFQYIQKVYDEFKNSIIKNIE